MRRQGAESEFNFFPEHHQRALGMNRDFTSLRRGGGFRVVERPHHGSTNDDPSDRPPEYEIHGSPRPGERDRVVLRVSRPKISEELQLAEALALLEIPKVRREIIVLDFSLGVDEVVARRDLEAEGNRIAIPVFEEPRRINWVQRAVGRGRDDTKRLLRDIRAGIDSQRVRGNISGIRI